MGKKATTIYVSMDSEIASTCFDVLTHDGYPDVLEEGISLSLNFGASGVAIVETDKVSGLTTMLNRAPGCRVTGYETQ